MASWSGSKDASGRLRRPRRVATAVALAAAPICAVLAGCVPVAPVLAVSRVAAPTYPITAGTRASASATVSVSGADAPATTATAYLAVGTTHSAADVRVGTQGLPGTKAGAARAIRIAFTVPAATPAGSYHFLVCADDPPKAVPASKPRICAAAPSAFVVTGTATALGLASYHQMAVDAKGGHVFLSGGQDPNPAGAPDSLVVTDLGGRRIGTVAGLSGTWGLAFSPKTHRLFATIPSADQVAVVDTTTLKVVSRLAAPAGSDPTWAALAGGRLWVSRGGEPDVADLLVTDVAAPGALRNVETGLGLDKGYLASAGEDKPFLTTSLDETLLTSPVRLWRVAADGSLSQVGQVLTESFVDEVSFSPDGSSFAVAQSGGALVRRWSTTDVSGLGAYTVGLVANQRDTCNIVPNFISSAGAFSADGRWFVGGSELGVFPVDSARPVRALDLGCIYPRGIATDSTGAHTYAVTEAASGPVLRVVAAPGDASLPPVPAPPLGLDTAGSSVFAAANRELFVSPGVYGSEVAVVGEIGVTGGSLLPRMYGASGMALSDDGSRLYVALATGDAIAVVDTATLKEVARYPTGPLSAPTHVVLAGGRIWTDVRLPSTNVFGLASRPIGSTAAAPWDPAGRGDEVPCASAAEAATTLVTCKDGNMTLVRLAGASGTAIASRDPGVQSRIVFAPDGTSLSTNGVTYSATDLTTLRTYPAANLASDRTVRYTADGKYLITNGPGVLGTGQPAVQSVRTYDLATGALVGTRVVPGQGGTPGSNPRFVSFVDANSDGSYAYAVLDGQFGGAAPTLAVLTAAGH